MGRSWISSRSSRNSKGSTQRERGAGYECTDPELRKHSMSRARGRGPEAEDRPDPPRYHCHKVFCMIDL